MTPGSFLVVVGGPSDALRARSEGLHLRDTLLILLPAGGVLTAFLFRRPLAAGLTVAQNVLEHGSGGLWIDGCRVTAAGPSPSWKHRETARRTGVVPITGSTAAQAAARGRIERRGSPDAYQADHPGEHLGRWPTNLLLVHGPGCRLVGTKIVKGSNQPGTAKDAIIERTTKPNLKSIFQQLHAKDRAASFYTDPEHYGMEEVPAWNCQPDCPVRMLDESSGFLVGAGNVRDTTTPSAAKRVVYAGGWKDQSGNPNWYSNHGGGASRFYPQFPCLAEALDWLCRLVGST